MFKVQIKKARVVVSPFTADQMASIADTVMEAVKQRTQEGLNCDDQHAKGLVNNKWRYPERKSKAGVDPIRNWVSPRRWPKNRIKTMRAMQVKSATENRAIIGFIDPTTDMIAHINNQREKQFGISPHDRENVLLPAVRNALANLVTIKQES